jgi:exonuclease III
MWKNHPIIEKLKEFEETSTNNKNTIVIGDFNQNPYEIDFTDPHIFNCIDSKELINLLEKSSFSKRNLDIWYNPMWNFLGDYNFNNRKHRVTGTYFRYTENEEPIWNLLDGFIIRPSLMERINYSKSAILDKTESTEFLKPLIIRADKKNIKEELSDHLPIKLTLN